MQGAALPYQSLVSSSLTALGASGSANGSGQVNPASKSRNGSVSGFNSISSNGFGQANASIKPSASATPEISSVSAGATYDFSSLTAAALSKH